MAQLRPSKARHGPVRRSRAKSRLGAATLALALWIEPAGAINDHLLLCEGLLKTTGGGAEFIEIVNPTAAVVELEDVYLSDHKSYHLLPAGVPSLPGSDFIARFPAGTTIEPGEALVIALDGQQFRDEYPGLEADFEIEPADPLTPDMLDAGGTIGASEGLTDKGEGVVLFRWDGLSDLVQDLDMVRLGKPDEDNDLANKSGVAVEGPDPDSIPTSYATDAFDMPVPSSTPGSGVSTKRVDRESAAEETGAGNGATLDDETCEDILKTWDNDVDFTPPDPGCCVAVSRECYYEGQVDATDQDQLRDSLHALIEDHERVPWGSDRLWTLLETAQQDPHDAGSIVDIYRNESLDTQTSPSPYHREHAWPNSYGYPEEGKDASGVLEHRSNYPYSDSHALFLAHGDYNEERSNSLYRYCPISCEEKATLYNDGCGGGPLVYPGQHNWSRRVDNYGPSSSWETWRDRRGDVARALFYMDVRYAGGTHDDGSVEPDLGLTDSESLIADWKTGDNELEGYMGIASDLRQWHEEDPVDWAEMRHNDVVFWYQHNRNPFVDHPEWVDCVYDNDCYTAPLSDLVIGLDDGATEAVTGQTVTYELEVMNAGPTDLAAAIVSTRLDDERVDIAGALWICAPAAGSGPGTDCPPTGTAGDLESGVTVSLDTGDTVAFVLDVPVLLPAVGELIHTARVRIPTPARDPDLLDNRSTDRDELVGPCGSPMGRELTDQTVEDPQLYEACDWITVGPDLSVIAPGGELALRAGSRVTFNDGFSVESGARLSVEIDPALVP